MIESNLTAWWITVGITIALTIFAGINVLIAIKKDSKKETK
ncbi:hypothetical protein [Helicobacter saguini]|nr:hypothetical protein [Helicobacter saguini]